MLCNVGILGKYHQYAFVFLPYSSHRHQTSHCENMRASHWLMGYLQLSIYMVVSHVVFQTPRKVTKGRCCSHLLQSLSTQTFDSIPTINNFYSPSVTFDLLCTHQIHLPPIMGIRFIPNHLNNNLSQRQTGWKTCVDMRHGLGSDLDGDVVSFPQYERLHHSTRHVIGLHSQVKENRRRHGGCNPCYWN
jgi:hypothetical protein